MVFLTFGDEMANVSERFRLGHGVAESMYFGFIIADRLVEVVRGVRSGSAEINKEASAILSANDDASIRSVTESPLPSPISSEGKQEQETPVRARQGLRSRKI